MGTPEQKGIAGLISSLFDSILDTGSGNKALRVASDDGSVVGYGGGTEPVVASATGAGQFIVNSTDCLQYRQCTLAVTGTYSCTYVFEQSMDNVSWFTINGVDTIVITTGGWQSTKSGAANVLYYIPIFARYFRVRVSAYVSGTCTGTVSFYNSATLPQLLNTFSACFGTVAHDAVDSGNPVKIGGKANDTVSAPATAVSNGDRADALYDLYGAAYIRSYRPSVYNATYNTVTTANIRSGATSLISVYAHNTNAVAHYLQFYNSTGSTAGAPVIEFTMPPGTSGGLVQIGTDMLSLHGCPFTTGLTWAFSTTSNFYTAGAATNIKICVFYNPF